MKKALVSIIVPIYNVDAYVFKCISSLMNQTLKDIEIICINDCSPDFSHSILEKLAVTDERIKIINNEENLGVAKSRNLGIAAATGEYIGFVDGDDSVDLDYYEKLYTKAKKNDSDIVKGLCKMVYPDGSFRAHWYNKTVIQAVRKKMFLPTYYNHGFWLSIYKKSFIDEYDINFCNLTNGEDIVFLLKALCHAKKFDIIDSAYYYYYQRPNSVSYSYKEENVMSILNHFIHQVEFLNSIELDKKNYISYFSKHIIPAYERWFLIFKKLNFSSQLYKDYINGLIYIYKSTKYKEVFNNKNYLNSLKKENIEEYLKILHRQEFKVFLIFLGKFSIPAYRRQISYEGKKTFIFNILINHQVKVTQ